MVKFRGGRITKGGEIGPNEPVNAMYERIRMPPNIANRHMIRGREHLVAGEPDLDNMAKDYLV